jgi:exosortase/archaeosortase family protein
MYDGHAPPQPSIWVPSQRPILRFILTFIVIMGPFTLFFYGVLTKTAVFQSYLNLNAQVSALILRTFGEQATSNGPSLSGAISLEIRHGCDAILPTGLFTAAVLAFPIVMRLKWAAILIGGAGMVALNLVRIISLYYTQLHKPQWFHTMHVDVWQPAFIFLALLFWVIWALRATRPVPSHDNAE